MKNHPTKNTLLQFPQANAETKNCKRVFFSPPQEKLKIKKSPPLQKNKTSFHRTVQTLTDIALNVNRLEQNVCGLELYSFGRTAAHAGNIKIKRNLKKKGFGGYRKFVQVMKCVQVQKNATDVSGNNLSIWLHFFASTVVLSIPSFLNFVNPFFVTCNGWGHC